MTSIVKTTLAALAASLLCGTVIAPAQTAAQTVTELPSGLQEAVEKSRYRIREQEPGSAYGSSNPAQELRGRFTQSGVTVTSAGPWQWGMSLRGYGYGERMRAVQPARLVASGNRIEYRRGPLTEWYINDQRGLEQGFTLAEPPGKRRGQEPLVVRLEVNGDLQARVGAGGEQIEFVDARRQASVALQQAGGIRCERQPAGGADARGGGRAAAGGG